MLSAKLKKDILASLKSLNLYKIILFGSYAYGNPGEDSDIDLYVIIDDNTLPNNFDEKIKLKLMVSEKLLDFRMLHPVDLIVHTRLMNEKFNALNSSFSKEIRNKGICLYEKVS